MIEMARKAVSSSSAINKLRRGFLAAVKNTAKFRLAVRSVARVVGTPIVAAFAKARAAIKHFVSEMKTAQGRMRLLKGATSRLRSGLGSLGGLLRGGLLAGFIGIFAAVRGLTSLFGGMREAMEGATGSAGGAAILLRGARRWRW